MQSIRDIEYEKLKNLTSRHFSPKIYVTASEKAKAICHKNLLTPAEFLRPFGYFKDANIKYRSIEKERQLSSSTFHLNFKDSTEFECPTKEQIEHHIKDVVNSNAPERLENLKLRSKSKEGVQEELCRLDMPWFDKVTDAIFDYTSNHFEMNFLDHPWGIVYMITSKETDPSQEVRKLVQENNTKLHNMFGNSAVDTNVPRIILVLYEFTFEENNKLELAQKIVAKLQSDCIGYTPRLLIINTGEDTKSYENWAGHLYQTYYYPRHQIDYLTTDETSRGKHIPKSDRDLIRNILYDILIKNIIPFVEHKIRNLDVITAKKKGFGNAFKKFFSGNTKTDQTESYALVQDEASLRNLADTFFLLEDYENALANYKLFASEIKGKSPKFYGNAVEMQNLCILLLEKGQARKDTSFKKCYDEYLGSRTAIEFGIRTIIFHIYHCILTNNREEAQLFLEGARNIKNYFPFLNCIFYEQYAMMFLRCDPIWPRKYAFTMVLAGYTYNQVELRKYGQRCYYLANSLYKNVSWSMIQEHVNTVLGKNSFQNSESLESIRYFRKALENISQNDTAERHGVLIKETFSVISQIQANDQPNLLELDNAPKSPYYDEIIKFPFPKVIDEGFDITLEDDFFNFINDRKINKMFSEGVSQQDMLLTIDSDQLWFNMGKRLAAFILKRPEVSRFDAYDELSLKMMDCVHLSDKAKLLERMSREAYIGEDISVNVRVDNPYKVPLEIIDFRLEYELIEFASPEDAKIHQLESKMEDFVLNELEQKYITIIIRPEKQGVLKVKGVKWRIDCIEGKHYFQFKKPYMNTARIAVSLGKVEATVEGLKNQLCYGEVCNWQLKLTNTSDVKVEKIYITNSYPEMLGFENRELRAIEAGAMAEIPLLVRGSITGIYEIRFLLKVYYENGKTRYCRVVVPVEVQGSFIPKYFTTPCFDKKIISLQFDQVWSPHYQRQIANLNKETAGLTIEQIILLTDKWRLVETEMHKPIYRKQDNFLHCYVEKCHLDQPARVEEEDFTKLALKENLNWLKIDQGTESVLEYGQLIDYFNLTFKRFKLMQSMLPKGTVSQDTISLAITWRFVTETETLRGIHYLYKIPLNSNLLAAQVGPKKIFEEFPLQLRILSNRVITHNFNLHPSCMVPIKLRLSNVTSSHTLSFRVEALNADLPLNSREKLGSKYFVWEGITDLEVVDLKPMDNCTVDLNVVFFEPGVYDISKFKFNFYVSTRTGEIVKNVNDADLARTHNYEKIVFSSDRDQCLIEVVSS